MGRIDFTGATARRVSFAYSSRQTTYLEAYDKNGNLIDSDSGYGNLFTGRLDRLSVNGTNISYVLFHDAGNLWLVDDLIVEDLLRDTAAKYLPSDFERVLEMLNTINIGSSSQTQFVNRVIQLLKIILNWGGSEMKLEVYKPDGTLYGQYQSSAPPIIVDIPNAVIGEWEFKVTAIDIPYNNYPYALVIGKKSLSTPEPFSLPLATGWNMISFPGTLDDSSVDTLIPQSSNIIKPFYTYDPTNFSYKEVSEVKPGEGYWALSMADETLSANVTPVTSLVLNLMAGWNMIGGVNGTVDFTDPQDNPDGSVIPPLYTYNPTSFSYEEKTSIEQDKGYWTLALQDCTLTLTANAAPARNSKVKAVRTVKPDWTMPIQINTGSGIKELTLGIQSGASEGFDPYIDKAMPPMLGMDAKQPEISFLIEDRLFSRLSRDVRKNETNVIWNMEVESNAGTELKWDISSLPIDKDMSLQFAGTNTDMRVRNRIEVPSGKQVVMIMLKDRIPTKPELLQNYPNPFNPDTWIPYQLSEAGKVVISIYDVSGRLVRRLDLGNKEAGIYVSREKAAHWDGRNEAGEKVVSGVYFYTFTAGDFVTTKKMVTTR